jgi:hypothetical protein
MEEIEKLRIFYETWHPFIYALLERAGFAEREDQLQAMMTLCNLMGPKEATMALCDPDWKIRDSIKTREREAEHYRWMLHHAAWHRREIDGCQRTEIVVQVEDGADLSCYATRDMAVRRAKSIADGNELKPLANADKGIAPNPKDQQPKGTAASDELGNRDDTK